MAIWRQYLPVYHAVISGESCCGVYTFGNVIYILQEENRAQNCALQDTRHNHCGAGCLANHYHLLAAVSWECSDPFVSVVSCTIVPDLMGELGVGHFVEGLSEVEHDAICLVFHIDGSGPVVDGADELSLTQQLFPEPMLVLVQMPAYLTTHCMLHCLA